METSDLSLASDPTTPPETLEKLARSRDNRVLEALASNPGIPARLLRSLGLRFPDRALANPAFALMCLETPDFFHQLRPQQLLEFARSPALGPALSGILFRLPAPKDRAALGIELAGNPSCDPSLLATFALSLNPHTRRNAARNPSTPPGLLRVLWAAGALPDLSRSDPERRASEEAALEALALGGWARVLVASLGNLTPSLLREVLTRGGPPPPEALAALAGNPSTPEAALRSLLQGAPRFELEASSNPSLPPDLMRALARKENLRIGLARNPSLLPDLAVEFMADPSARLRAEAAASAAAPEAWRRRLAGLGIAGDLASIPDELGPASAEDFEALLGGGPWFLQVAAFLPGLTGEQCERLLARPGPHRLPVALRKGLPAWLLDRLWNEPQGEVRSTLRSTLARPQARAAPPGWGRARAPSLRAPVVVGQWLVGEGEQVRARTPVVELLCKGNGAVVRLEAPHDARVRRLVDFGQVAPGDEVAAFEPDASVPRRCEASERVAALLARAGGGLAPLATDPMPRDAIVDVLLPSLGESVAEATLRDWLVRPGDTVAEGQVIVTAGLDKCDVELTAPHAGVIASVSGGDDDPVAVGGVYLRMVRFSFDK